jgi:hypothetical protein
MTSEQLIRNVLDRAVDMRASWIRDGLSESQQAGFWSDEHYRLRDKPADPSPVLLARQGGGPEVLPEAYRVPFLALAAYYPRDDQIVHLPELKGYRLAQTVAHELCHASGHPSRLNREALRLVCAGKVTPWAPKRPFAIEELIAELGSVVVLDQLGFEVELLAAIYYCAGPLDGIPRLHRDVVVRQALEAGEFVLRGEWS